MASHYHYGKRKELQLGEFLERRGFAWARAQGSRGPGDLIAIRGRQRLAIQVKATRKDRTSYARLSQEEEQALVRSARARKAIPALALVSRNHVWLIRIPDETLLGQGELKPLNYVYGGET